MFDLNMTTSTIYDANGKNAFEPGPAQPLAMVMFRYLYHTWGLLGSLGAFWCLWGDFVGCWGRTFGVSWDYIFWSSGFSGDPWEGHSWVLLSLGGFWCPWRDYCHHQGTLREFWCFRGNFVVLRGAFVALWGTLGLILVPDSEGISKTGICYGYRVGESNAWRKRGREKNCMLIIASYDG